MATIKEIAELAGVSPTTVANVIHGRVARVSPETLERVKAILERERYAPNMGAVMLARNNSRIIGVIMFREPRRNETALEDPFSSMILGAIEREIHKSGYYMMLQITDDEEDVLRLAARWKIEGLILIWVPGETAGIIRLSTEKPVVFVDCFFEEDGQTYYNVGLDDERGGYEVADYLLSMGHREIAFFADSGFLPGTGLARFQGSRKAFEARGLSLTMDRFSAISKDFNERQELYARLTAKDSPLTALAFFSDYYAAEAVMFCQEHGIEVPARISITGFDDNIFSRLVRPRLTTVNQDAFRKGREAVSMLLALLAGEKVPEPYLRLPVRLEIRDSVRPLAQD